MATIFLALSSGGSPLQGAETAGGAAAVNWTPPAIALAKEVKHPVVACTPVELERLRAAWKGSGPAHDTVADKIKLAEDDLKVELVFPPEGGHHNQWYQCDKCETGLTTVDATHHKCPKCGKVYSGFPYDNCVMSRTHGLNGVRMVNAAWAYAVTGRREFADLAARVMVGYGERYLNYPMVSNGVSDKSIDVSKLTDHRYKMGGHMFEQTLNESMWMMHLATAYDLIYDSGALSAEQKTQVETKLIRAMIDCIAKNNMGKSNWQTWHNAAMIWAGAVLGDESWVQRAILDPENGFVYQMTASVMPEGMWFENSWGYHYYTLIALTNMAEAGRRLGLDLYGHPMLKKMYLLAFDYQMSDGSLPRFGDAVQDTPENSPVNEEAWAAYHEERILSALPAKPSWNAVLLGRDLAQQATRPQPTSHLIAGAGHAILCTDGPGKLSAAMTFGPYGGFHGHFDKLSFVFFGQGQECGVDPGRKASQAYRLPIHRDWYKASAGHNTVLVDGLGQKETGGEWLCYGADTSYAIVGADAGPAFENVSQSRFLLLTPSYLLVFDSFSAKDGQEHTYDWVYHNRGSQVTCNLPAAGAESKLGLPAGYGYLQNVKSYAVADGAKATGDSAKAAAATEFLLRALFAMDKMNLNLTMITQPGDQVFTADGPFKSVDDRVPVIVVRRKGTNVTFCTVLEPTAWGGASQVKSVTLDFKDKGAVWATVTMLDGERDTLNALGGTSASLSVENGGTRHVLFTAHGKWPPDSKRTPSSPAAGRAAP